MENKDTTIQVSANPSYDEDGAWQEPPEGVSKAMAGGFTVAALGAGVLIGFLAFNGGAAPAPAPTPAPTPAPAPTEPTATMAPTSTPESFMIVDELALEYAARGCDASTAESRRMLDVDTDLVDIAKLIEGDEFAGVKKQFTGGARAQAKTSCTDMLDQIKDLDTTGWSTDQIVLRELLHETVKFDLLEVEFPYERYIPVHSMRGPVRSYGGYVNPTLVTAEDFQSHAEDVQYLAEYADTCVDRMTEGLELGYKAHSQTVEFMPEVIAEMLDVPSMKELAVLTKAFSLIDSVPGAKQYEDLLVSAGQNLTASFSAFADYLEDTYVPALKASGPESFSIKDRVPANKRAIYDDYLVPYYTSTNMTADEVHERGLEEAARITARMEEIAKRQGFDSVESYRDALQELDTNKYENKWDMVAYHKEQGLALYPLLNALFTNMPDIGFFVEAIPEASATPDRGASYTSSKRRVNINAVYYENFRRHTAPALMAHEGVPGHHLQLQTARRIQGLHPLRARLRFTSYTEGWGLYSEYLAENDMDFYQDDAAMFGRLQLEQMRAARLVVDTGLHHKGWTYDDCVIFMFDNYAASQAASEGQCLRYIGLVGQALAYKSGEIVIKELRARAEAALGENFDIKAWHNEVLQAGMPPVNVLETIMDTWVAREVASFA